MPSRDDLYEKAKNQIYTPGHIVDLMKALCSVTEGSKVLDPTCGDGKILERVNTENAYGIEYDVDSAEVAKTTGAAIICGSCFDAAEQIKEWNIDTVLMNPPYNAPADGIPSYLKEGWAKPKEDPTKGLCFVRWVADTVGKGKLAAVLPTSTVQNSKKQIQKQKEAIFKNHTIEAVITLPNDLFYPSAGVGTLLLILTLGIPHNPEKEVVFYNLENDGYVKGKNCRKEEKPGAWEAIKEEVLRNIENREEIENVMVISKIKQDDNWNFSNFRKIDTRPTAWDFYVTVRDYMEWKINSERKKRDAELKKIMETMTLEEYCQYQKRNGNL